MITEDKQSVDLLFIALNKLLQNKSIDELTVKNITDEAGVSRATFYRHFYDKYDLLNTNYESILERTLFKFNEGMSWNEAVGSIYLEIKNNIKLFQNALKSSDLNSLKNYIFNMSIEFHMNILKNNGIDIDDWKVRKMFESYIYGNLKIMEEWILNGMKEPIEEMMDVFDSGIPYKFARYFK